MFLNVRVLLHAAPQPKSTVVFNDLIIISISTALRVRSASSLEFKRQRWQRLDANLKSAACLNETKK